MSIADKHNLTETQIEEIIQRVSNSTGTPLEKVASAAENFVYPIAAGAAAAGVSYALPAAIEAMQNARVRNNKEEYIRAMKKVHPDLKELAKEDIDVAYNSLAQHTPDVLRDPLLGGQTLKQFAKYRMADVKTLGEISKLRGRAAQLDARNPMDYLGSGVDSGIRGLRSSPNKGK